MTAGAAIVDSACDSIVISVCLKVFEKSGIERCFFREAYATLILVSVSRVYQSSAAQQLQDLQDCSSGPEHCKWPFSRAGYDVLVPV